MIIFIISFLAGILTVLAPCVLPLLPVIVGGSVTGAAGAQPSKKKALIVTISLGISVILFTFLLKVSTLFINIPAEIWSWISGTIIIILGLVTLFPALWDKMKFMRNANKESNKLLAVGYKKDSIWGDIIIGASLGPVFSSCSPTYFFILATVLPLSPIVGFFDLLAYAIGLCLALLVIAFVGQKVIEKLGIASDPYGWFKRTLGALFLLVGIAIFFGQDKIFEAQLLTSGIFDITKVEQVLLKNVSNTGGLQITPDQSTTTPMTADSIFPKSSSTATPAASPAVPAASKPVASETAAERISRESKLYPKAPELVNPSGFVNTGGQPIKLADFKGKKVVLLDVWTYSCINCQRTLPYVKAWYDRYKDLGLEIVGLHTPEFSFEKVQKNVEDAVARDGIKYPVVLDNNYATWNAYGNQYWPRKYLIDTDGFVVYDHIGEGDYDVTEQAIQKALLERAVLLGDVTSTAALTKMMAMGTSGIAEPKDAISFDGQRVGSPETYFGAGRNEYFGNGKAGGSGDQTLTLPTPDKASPDLFYLGGTWNLVPEYAESKSLDTTLLYNYSAKNVYMVASADPAILAAHPAGVDVEVWVDGKIVSTVTVKDEKLYTLVQGTDYGAHTLLLKIRNAGLKAFTFTFG